MKQLIERLKHLDTKFRKDGLYGTEVKEYQDALPELLDRLEKLEAAVEVAKYFLDERELLMDEYYSVRGDDEQFKLFQEKEKQWRDARAALEGEKE